MLKWTLNKRIDPCAPYRAAASIALGSNGVRNNKRRSMGTTNDATNITAEQRQQAREQRRKSLATAADLTRRYRNRNKENLVAVVASPHPIALGRRNATALATTPTATTTAIATNHTPITPYAHRNVVFRDVANTPPQRLSLTNNDPNGTPQIRFTKRTLPPSPLMPRALNLSSTPPPSRSLVAETTSTTETQEPASLSLSVPLTGHTVPNAFFTQLTDARYLPSPTIATDPQPTSNRTSPSPLSRRLAELRFSKISIQRRHIYNSTIPCADEEPADIDMSSRALNDTALDRMLDQILYSTRKPNAPPQIEDTSSQQSTVDTSPVSDVCQLRRQGGLRRKRTAKATATTATTTVQRKRQMDDLMEHHPYLRQSIEILAGMETPPKKMRWM